MEEGLITQYFLLQQLTKAVQDVGLLEASLVHLTNLLDYKYKLIVLQII